MRKANRKPDGLTLMKPDATMEFRAPQPLATQRPAAGSAFPDRSRRRGIAWLRRRDILIPLACCAALLASIAIAWPFADTAFNDDWSYSFTARQFAESGRIAYNGWGSPMILFQVLWAGLWIHVAGFSFNLLRWITLPFSTGVVLLVYGLGRQAGLTRQHSAFAALATGTSPLFVPLAASFMTDPYGCFFVLLAIYAAMRSAKASGSGASAGWLWVSAGSALLAGSVRQIGWAAVALVPCVAWLRKEETRLRKHAAAALAVCCGCIALLVYNFRPPYGPAAVGVQGLFAIFKSSPGYFGGRLVSLVLSSAFFSVPALVCAIQWRGISANRAAIALLGGSILAVFPMYTIAGAGVAPYLGNTVTRWGVMGDGQDLLRSRPAIFPLGAWVAISLAVSCLLMMVVPAVTRATLPRSYIRLAGTFCLLYMLPTLPGLFTGFVYDRYLLPLLPLGLIVFLSVNQAQAGRIPRRAWAVLLLFAVYGVCTTHDYYAGLRAKLTVHRALLARGVPNHSISAGFEIDGWKQLEATGHIRGVRNGDFGGKPEEGFWFWRFTPSITPEYVLAYAHSPKAGEIALPIRSWLPTRAYFLTVEGQVRSGN
jgi:hypothetical protein